MLLVLLLLGRHFRVAAAEEKPVNVAAVQGRFLERLQRPNHRQNPLQPAPTGSNPVEPAKNGTTSEKPSKTQ